MTPEQALAQLVTALNAALESVQPITRQMIAAAAKPALDALEQELAKNRG